IVSVAVSLTRTAPRMRSPLTKVPLVEFKSSRTNPVSSWVRRQWCPETEGTLTTRSQSGLEPIVTELDIVIVGQLSTPWRYRDDRGAKLARKIEFALCMIPSKAAEWNGSANPKSTGAQRTISAGSLVVA